MVSDRRMVSGPRYGMLCRVSELFSLLIRLDGLNDTNFAYHFSVESTDFSVCMVIRHNSDTRALDIESMQKIGSHAEHVV